MMNIRVENNDIKAINQAIKAILDENGLKGDRRLSGWKKVPAWRKAVEKAIESHYPELVVVPGEGVDAALEKAEAYEKVAAKVKAYWN